MKLPTLSEEMVSVDTNRRCFWAFTTCSDCAVVERWCMCSALQSTSAKCVCGVKVVVLVQDRGG